MPPITGIMPVAPAAFDDDECLDLESQRRVTDFLIDAGVDGISVMANYTEQFALSDEERAEVINTTLEHVAGRVPVCVATSHYSARVANARNREAQEGGASLVMMMPPFYGSGMHVEERALVDYFRRALEGVTIPLMLQDSPLNPTTITSETVARLARKLPTLQYAKIEIRDSATKIRAVKKAAGDDLPAIYDGEEAVTLIPDLQSGAVGAMTSSLLPDKIGDAVRCYFQGEKNKAIDLWENLLPLIQFENRHCGLRAMKEVLHAGGVLSSATTRAPLSPLDDHTREGLLELARRKNILGLMWGR